MIATLQLDYAQKYGVASLKIRHHAQLGYVIEAPAAAVEKLRAHPDLTLRQGDGQRRALHRARSCPTSTAASPRPPSGRPRASALVFAHLVAAALARRRGAGRAAPTALALLDVAQSAAALADPGHLVPARR